MLLYIQIDPIEAIASVKVRDYPAMTSETGSPFSTGITHLGDGLYSVNIGSVTGRWVVHAFNATSELLRQGYASDEFVDGSGNATVSDHPPWLATAAGSGLDAAGIRAAVGLESANLSHLVNAIVGKNNVVNNGDGTYNIAVRNAADTATLVTIQFNPTTGAKTVV